jgi:predicted ATP-grasp superfamily ATP-dependent carboligase
MAGEQNDDAPVSEVRSEATNGLESTDTTRRGAQSFAPKPAPVGAVVVGGDYQGLGVVRSLGRHGIPVYVIDDEPSISRYSRYATKSFRVPELRVSARIVETVMDIGRRFGLDGWVLYPTRDEIVAAFAQHKQELSKIFRVPTPGWESVRPAWDKRLTYELAARLGIPAPETHVVSDLAELRSLDLRLPVALKPAIKEHFIYVTKVKALRADTAAELDAVFRQTCNVIPVEEVMVQELIPGDGECQFSYCGFFKEGKPLAKMLVRRARQRPAVFGRSSTYVETVDMPELEEPSERFLEAIGYYGLAEMEYKFDQRDGRYKILDVNLRTWGSHTIGRPAGVDFAYLLFRDQLGQPVDPVRAKAGVRWIRLATDLPTSLGQISRGRLSWRVFLKSLVSFDIEAVFARDDPRPGLAEITLLPHLIRTRSTRGWKGHSG